jgi:Coenzyme PQQ synthesis protein D (PqqD)
LTAISGATRVRRSRVAQFRRRDGETIVVRLGPEVVALEDVAALLWELFDGKRSLDEVVAEVASEYDVTPDVVEADVREFAGDMIDRGFLVAAE